MALVFIRWLAGAVKKTQDGGVSKFLERVSRELGQHRLLVRGQKILVAVSGGVDSMVLLHALHSLSAQNRWRLSVAHFNHRLRGRASEADAALVRKNAKKWGMEYSEEAADVKSFATRAGISIEMAARKLRHEFLARTARRQKLAVIALAHHADDQVELFFLRFLRGAGGAGLAGMKRSSPSPADSRITLVRPLLNFSKLELLNYAREHRLPFRQDASNFSNDHLRNRIRNQLLPQLEKDYQVGLAGNVLRLMEIVGAESELAASLARDWLKSEAATQGKARFDDLPLAVQRKVLQQQLLEQGVVTDFDLVERLRLLPNQFVSVGSDFSVMRDHYGWIGLRRAEAVVFKADEQACSLSGRSGKVTFNRHKFQWQVQPHRTKAGFVPPKPQAGREQFDADRIGEHIILRHWRAGDRFQPLGLAAPSKLQDLFVNAKIPAAQRRNLVLATTQAGEIFWVEGLRIGEQFKLTSKTRRKLIWITGVE